MSLEAAAIPLALFAGVMGVVSPCVWPLVPVVMSSASASGRSGPVFLASGLSLSFAIAGTGLTWLLVSTGMDPEFLRYFAATMLLLVAGAILVRPLGEWVQRRLSALTSWMPAGSSDRPVSGASQFGVGALLGVVWLPCVGPTLGAAIALASMGQEFGMAFVVMLAYGIGTGGVLLLAGLASNRLLARWRPRVMSSGKAGKQVLGWSLALLGVLVLTGFDKTLETLAVKLLPGWVFGL